MSPTPVRRHNSRVGSIEHSLASAQPVSTHALGSETATTKYRRGSSGPTARICGGGFGNGLGVWCVGVIVAHGARGYTARALLQEGRNSQKLTILRLAHHSDHGSQYVNIVYSERLADTGSLRPQGQSVTPTTMPLPKTSTRGSQRSHSKKNKQARHAFCTQRWCAFGPGLEPSGSNSCWFSGRYLRAVEGQQ